MFKFTRILLRSGQFTTKTCVRYRSNVQTKLSNVTKHTHSDTIANVLKNVEISSSSDWARVKKQVLEASNFINSKNFDALLFQHCTSSENYALGEKYFDFLVGQNPELSLGVIGKYFRFYYFMKENNFVTKRTDEDIIGIYENLRKKYSVFDSVTGEHLICALSITKHWKDCLKLLEDIKITNTPSTEAYSLTASAAFVNNEDVLGFSVLEEMFLNNRVPQARAYLTYIKCCQESSTLGPKEKVERLEKLFYFFEAHDVKCERDVASRVLEVISGLSCEAKVTRVSVKGDCFNCKRRLQRLHLTNREFDELKASFFEKAIIGKNVYSKTSPQEIGKFQDFIAGGERFDVVIDGLNVAFSAGKSTPQVASMMILSVVNHFARENKKVLVIGRKHMEKWPSKNMRVIKSNASVFLTENLSYDDPFLLYCALNSGMNTIIVSNDLMRSHLFLLKDLQHKRLFSKWLGNCQHLLLRVDKQGKPIFMPPVPYLRCVQKEDRFWHLPCVGPPGDENNVKDWICLKT